MKDIVSSRKKKVKVLYLVPFIKPFILEPITELIATNEIDCVIDFHFSLYSYIRNQAFRKMVQKYRSDKDMLAQKKKLTLFWGLPKELLSQCYPDWIAKLLEYKYSEGKFDLIHAHTILPSGYVAYILSKKWNIPFIVTSHGMDFYRCLPDVSKYRHTKQYDSRNLKKANIVLNNSNHIIAVSKNYAKQILKSNSNANVKVIENSYNKNIFRKESKSDARNKLSIPLNDKILISIGNFVKSKGHIYLLEAMIEVVKKHHDVKLYIIGGGMLQELYNEIIEHNHLSDFVFLLDAIPQRELALWNNAADIFIFPSISESFGVALIEAMACGVPVIVADSDGPAEIINNLKTGIIVKKRSSSEIAQSILDLLDNDSFRNRISEMGMDEIQKRFSQKNYEYLKLYKDLINI